MYKMSKNEAKSSTLLSFASITFSRHLPCVSIVKCQCHSVALIRQCKIMSTVVITNNEVAYPAGPVHQCTWITPADSLCDFFPSVVIS